MNKFIRLKIELDKIGFPMSIPNLRKLEKFGIIFTTRNKSSNYRELDDAMFNKSMRNIILYIFYTPIEDIIKNDASVIASRIKKIKKALKLLY
jgi:hypothetical protein